VSRYQTELTTKETMLMALQQDMGSLSAKHSEQQKQMEENIRSQCDAAECQFIRLLLVAVGHRLLSLYNMPDCLGLFDRIVMFVTFSCQLVAQQNKTKVIKRRNPVQNAGGSH